MHVDLHIPRLGPEMKHCQERQQMHERIRGSCVAAATVDMTGKAASGVIIESSEDKDDWS